jgi:hypothetical protein
LPTANSIALSSKGSVCARAFAILASSDFSASLVATSASLLLVSA